MLSNLPPGVTLSMLEDQYLTEEQLEAVCRFHNITDDQFADLDESRKQTLVRKVPLASM